jgi:hypothetical protein
MFGIGRMIKSFLNPGKGYEKGQEQLDKYYNQSQNYYKPYAKHGEEAYGGLSSAMESLLNPTDLYDQWLNEYEMSDAAKMNQDRALEQGLDAASSMGLMGSSPALKAIQAGTAQIGADDKLRYINQLMNMYLPGAQIAQSIYGTGAQAGNAMGQNASQMGQNSAQLAFGRQNAPGMLFNDLLKSGITAYMASKKGSGGGSGGSSGGGNGGWSTVGGS